MKKSLMRYWIVLGTYMASKKSNQWILSLLDGIVTNLAGDLILPFIWVQPLKTVMSLENQLKIKCG